MLRKTMTSSLLVFLVATTAFAQGSIFLVRHAERADTAGGGAPMMAADPSLSDAGRQRAESLATLLKDAGITAIYATEFKRTQETAAPLAKALGLAVTTVPTKDTAGLIQKLKGATGNVLVVGHSTTVPEIVKALGVTSPVKIDDNEYDNLLIVISSGTQPHLIRLHFR
jgi:broad specificity phosphatase PhoE